MVPPERIFIGLGANLEDPLQQLLQAVAALKQGAPALGLRWLALSSLYRTRPWEAEGPDFLNAVAVLEGQAQPRAVLQWLQRLETEAGRTRPYRNAPRTLDLDILHHGSRRVQEPDLVIPHPRAAERPFVQVPLRELASGGLTPMPAESGILRLDEALWPVLLPSSGCSP